TRRTLPRTTGLVMQWRRRQASCLRRQASAGCPPRSVASPICALHKRRPFAALQRSTTDLVHFLSADEILAAVDVHAPSEVQDWRYVVSNDEGDRQRRAETGQGKTSWSRLMSAVLMGGAAVMLAGSTREQMWQGRRWAPVGDAVDGPIERVPYDGRFTFARLRYQTAPGGYYYRGLPAWAHGYPVAERNLTRITNEITLLRARAAASNVCDLADAGLD